MWHQIHKTNGGIEGIEQQVWIGKRRVDFLLSAEKTAIEIDGRQWHNAAADELRDRELLHSIDAVIHIPAAAVKFFPEAIFCVMSQWLERFQTEEPYRLHCVPFHLLEAEIERHITPNGDFWNRDLVIKEYEGDWDVWDVAGDVGRVGSMKAFLFGWKKLAIVRNTRHTATGSLRRVTA